MILQEEHVLIDELKRGSKRAFDKIYSLYAGRLYSYCMKFTKNREDAEEIVQDVFIALWNNRESIRKETTLNSVLFSISKYRVINAYRSSLNTPIYEDYVKYQDEIYTKDNFSWMEYEEYVKSIKSAIHKLPLTQQRVIILSRFSQLSNKEIAKELSLSEQTVKNQLSIGLKTLRRLLMTLLTISIVLNIKIAISLVH